MGDHLKVWMFEWVERLIVFSLQSQQPEAPGL